MIDSDQESLRHTRSPVIDLNSMFLEFSICLQSFLLRVSASDDNREHLGTLDRLFHLQNAMPTCPSAACWRQTYHSESTQRLSAKIDHLIAHFAGVGLDLKAEKIHKSSQLRYLNELLREFWHQQAFFRF